jgi:hypothetical protein
MKCILVLMAQFQIWDGLITHVFVNNGLVKEGNPLVASLVNGGNFLFLKVMGVSICVPILWIIYKRFPKFTMVTASSLVMFYAAAIFWNFLVFFGIA